MPIQLESALEVDLLEALGQGSPLLLVVHRVLQSGREDDLLCFGHVDSVKILSHRRLQFLDHFPDHGQAFLQLLLVELAFLGFLYG